MSRFARLADIENRFVQRERSILGTILQKISQLDQRLRLLAQKEAAVQDVDPRLRLVADAYFNRCQMEERQILAQREELEKALSFQREKVRKRIVKRKSYQTMQDREDQACSLRERRQEESDVLEFIAQRHVSQSSDAIEPKGKDKQ